MHEMHMIGGSIGGNGGVGSGGGDADGNRSLRGRRLFEDGRMKLNHHHHQRLQQEALKCPRCDSLSTKFCYYNNYNLSQPRYFCKCCRRYWTKGGVLRNVPVGGGCRKIKRSNTTTINNHHINKHHNSSPAGPLKAVAAGGSSRSSSSESTTNPAAAVTPTTPATLRRQPVSESSSCTFADYTSCACAAGSIINTYAEPQNKLYACCASSSVGGVNFESNAEADGGRGPVGFFPENGSLMSLTVAGNFMSGGGENTAALLPRTFVDDDDDEGNWRADWQTNMEESRRSETMSRALQGMDAASLNNFDSTYHGHITDRLPPWAAGFNWQANHGGAVAGGHHQHNLDLDLDHDHHHHREGGLFDLHPTSTIETACNWNFQTIEWCDHDQQPLYLP
ncbi:hypothetical protein Dimus_005089 [Dionaea muscipula]